MYWQHAVIFSGKHNFGISLQEIDSEFSGRDERNRIKKKLKQLVQFTSAEPSAKHSNIVLRVGQIQLFVFSKRHEDSMNQIPTAVENLK